MLTQMDTASRCVDTSVTPNRLMVTVTNWPSPLNVQVGNFPASWSVAKWPAGFNVNNWPNPFVVQVGNFPASFNVGNLPATWAISNFPAATIARSDVQAQARAGTLYAITSGMVAVILGSQNNVLTIANPASSGRVIYLGSVNVQSTVTATVNRIRGATIAGTQANASGTAAGGVIPGAATATAKTGGTATSGTPESVSISGQGDPAQHGTIRINPGESLTWALTVTVLGNAAVSVQAWSEPVS